MSYDAKGLQVGEGFGTTGSSSGADKIYREARYVTNDAPSAVEAAGYFNSAVARLPKGTVIHAVMNLSTTPIFKTYVVTANSGSVVTIELQETGAGGGVTPITVLQKDLISTKGSDAAVQRWIAPFKGKINKGRSVLNDVLATADATVTFAINGVPVTNGVITITSPGAAGDKDECTPTALNTFAAGDTITATVGGGSTATGTANLQVEIEETA